MEANKLTFSKKVKDELVSNIENYTLEEKKGILSAYIRNVGSISILPNKSLRLVSSSANISKFIFSLLKDIYSVNPSFTYTKQLRLAKNLIYHLEVNEKLTFILEDLEIYKDLEIINPVKMLDEKHFKGYIIGLVLASGQISNPKGKTYYCELSFNEERLAKLILNKLNHFKKLDTMTFKMILRRNKYVLYLKRSDQISMFLSFIGAIEMMYEFENSRLEKDYFNNENRLIICATANYNRCLLTGENNIKDINLLTKYYGKDYFKGKVKWVVDTRLANPDASYQDISDILSNKQCYISKSGVARIFKQLSNSASKLKK